MDDNFSPRQWPDWIARIGRESVAVASRLLLADRLAAEMARGDLATGDAVLTELTQVLAHDPDWRVRLAVVRVLYLLDSEVGASLILQMGNDCNSFVRNNAQQSLARMTRFRQRQSQEQQRTKTYLQQLNRLADKHGKSVAAKVRELAELRYAMLTSTLAHGFRSILTTLTANTERLLKGANGSSCAASIREDIAVIGHLLENLDLFTRDLPVDRHHESLEEMVRSAIEKAQMKIIHLGYDIQPVKVRVDLPEGVRIRVTRQPMVLALINLIKNAYEAFAVDDDRLVDGLIEIWAVIEGYELQILIRDSGRGIEPGALNTLRTFAPGDINKAKRESSGFGLPLAHRYIAANDGVLEIDSRVDEGTVVVVKMPLRSSED